MICHLAASTGWRIEEVLELSLADCHRLLRYFRSHPPAHIVVAAAFLEKTPPWRSEVAKETFPALEDEPPEFEAGA